MKEASFVGTLVSPISPMINLMCILFFSFLVRKSCGVDPRFLGCSVPQTCGDSQNITFPFFVEGSQQKNYSCGHPGFPISCKINGQPTITIFDVNYTIHQIFYQNQTIRVSNSDFSNSNTGCIPLIKNISFPLVRFELAPRQSNLLLLYNCSNSSALPGDLQFYDGCYGEKVLALSEEDPKLEDVSNECKTRVVAHVEAAAYGGEKHDEIRGALENGFWLKWKASDCSNCKHSGGFCGTEPEDNSNYRFQCFCADGPDYERCNSPENNKKNLAIGIGIEKTTPPKNFPPPSSDSAPASQFRQAHAAHQAPPSTRRSHRLDSIPTPSATLLQRFTIAAPAEESEKTHSSTGLCGRTANCTSRVDRGILGGGHCLNYPSLTAKEVYGPYAPVINMFYPNFTTIVKDNMKAANLRVMDHQSLVKGILPTMEYPYATTFAMSQDLVDSSTTIDIDADNITA
ncbi:hypothetical protein FH972_015860 [Carpinus fangiana]|uniref:non-specific serine/threonine protein kinase n=1 Tax=Carpinus fangiana TaxID=176857 RepID=A0A5N6RE25_9ROSI|nr:hypothetical protein FH972_015860 [Carpinus fangiana]